MKVSPLIPKIEIRYKFSLRFQKFIPNQPGCYILSTFDDEILYIGKSDNLRRRFGEHRASKEKTNLTTQGKAFWFYFMTCIEKDLYKIERTWLKKREKMNKHLRSLIF
jgi:excinuclease UvrABC nuclease subunit